MPSLEIACKMRAFGYIAHAICRHDCIAFSNVAKWYIAHAIFRIITIPIESKDKYYIAHAVCRHKASVLATLSK